jgi:hypothetical protein
MLSGKRRVIAQPLIHTNQMHDGIDQHQVREGLREVPKVQAAVGIGRLLLTLIADVARLETTASWCLEPMSTSQRAKRSHAA